MGLAGRREKQRIAHDPRNLSWADDANKFGAAYMQKLGWSAGTGLGTSGDGRTSHIKVHQKLDMLGIGAAHQKDPNGLAWKQNKDFENLLRRLNAANGDGEAEEVSAKIDGFSKAQELTTVDAETEPSKKRKRDGGDVETKSEVAEETKEERKKRKREEKEKKKLEKKAKKLEKKERADEEDKPPQEPTTPAPSRPAVGRPVRAHRARFMASKNIAAKSSAAIDEILGISRSGTSTPYPTTSIPDTPAEPSTSSSPSEEDGLRLQELTISTKSVMDYFKEKLLAKSNSASGSSTPAPSSSIPSPRDTEVYDDYDDRPRGGLGIGAAPSRMGLGSSKLRTEVTVEQDFEETTRVGLGAFSRMSTMFSAATVSDTPSETVLNSVETTVVEETATSEVVDREKAERKKKKKNDKGKRREEAVSEADDGDVSQEASSKKSKKHKRSKTTKESLDVEVSDGEKKKPKKRQAREDDGEDDEARQSRRRKKEAKDAGGDSVNEERPKKKKKSKKVKSAEFVDDS